MYRTLLQSSPNWTGRTGLKLRIIQTELVLESFILIIAMYEFLLHIAFSLY